MLSAFIGQVDLPAAAVLVAMFACACIVTTSLIVKRRSRMVINNEFELAKMKQKGEDERAMFVVATDREYKIKQVDQGLITSHKRD